MNIKLRAFAILMSVILFLVGCGGNQPTEVEPVSEVVNDEPEVDVAAIEIEKFFTDYVNTSERPIAVMIDNDDKNARPQAGLDEAYLIYEMIVEGGSTRFMALYRGNNVEKIGPVRSSRHYFLDYVMENDAIYTHFGWSPKAITDISAFGINKINGVLGGDGDIFWREQKFKGDWHSAYTNTEKIKDMAVRKGYRTETEIENGINYSDTDITLPAENSAQWVNLDYSYQYSTGYKYNAEKKVYEKYINNAPHVMQNGNTVEVKNIIIELIYDSSLGDGTDRRNVNTVGSGDGYYITNGVFEKITWTKSSRRDKTIYKREDGTELFVNAGKTIVNIISPSATITME